MQENNQYRLYTFTNFYLSSIQKGIQSAHVVSTLGSQYRSQTNNATTELEKWEDAGVTLIVLNGGNQRSILDGYECIKKFSDLVPLPHAIFREDEDSLGGAVTACGVVLPPEYWQVADDIRNRRITMDDVYNRFENSIIFNGNIAVDFYTYLTSCPLAN